ncbi:MAG: peptidoglycan-binding protein [Clostridia bacterium]|nr:peptidoglycan-binding protein [Clostridia bacterium]
MVQYLQSTLKTLGYYFGKIDGIFGTQTQKSVKKFQKDFGLTPDGIVGQQTWNKILIYGYIVPTDISYGYNVLSINIRNLKDKYPFLEVGNIGYTSLRKSNTIYKIWSRSKTNSLLCLNTRK